MKTIGRWPAVLLAALVSVGYSADRATAQTAQEACLVGQIVELSGITSKANGVIVSTPIGVKPKLSQPAHRRQCLKPGERVRVTDPTAKVTIRILRSHVTLTSASEEYTAPLKPVPSFWADVSNVVRGFRIFSTTSESVAVETFGRRGLPTIQAHPLLPVGSQRFPADQASIAVAWEGPTPFVELRNAEGLISSSRLRPPENLVVLQRGRVKGNATLVVGEQLSYPLRFVDRSAIKEPPWMDRPSVSDDERVARAIWLLLEGPADLRLFALTELNELQGSSFAAERMLEWVRKGRYAEGMPNP